MGDTGAPGSKGAGDGAPDSAPDGAANTSNPVLAPGADLPRGFTVGEYRIQGIAGRGGMGVVYAAMHPVIEKKVAIKVLAAHFSSTPDLVRRFVDEARAVNRIGHENIIDIFSFGQLADGRQYFVMEYLEGATLGQRLERGDLRQDEFPAILAQICDALDAAHAKQIVHRDLKPENVWIAMSTRGQPKVRLLDFGIAKLLDTGDRVVTDIGAVMGTPHYMSPEQCHGRGVDHRTDIYAMGVLLYRIYTGRLPFRGETFAEILAKQITETPPAPSTIATIPAELDRVIMRCLDKDPTRRPQTAVDLGSALAAALSGRAAAAPQAIPEHLIETSMALPATDLAPPKVSDPAPPKASNPAVESTAPVIRPPATPTRSRTPVVVGAIVAGLVAIGIAWFALRSSGTDGGKEATAPVTAPAAAPAPAPPPNVSPPAPASPSPSEPAAAPQPTAPAARQGPAPRAPATAPERAATNKRRVGSPESPAAPPAERPPAPKPSRASSTGLETRNPFE